MTQLLLVNAILIVLSAVILVPIAVFAVESLAAIFYFGNDKRIENRSENVGQPRTVVLIPAHNEQLVIEETLRSILVGRIDDPAQEQNARVLVVADNCDDRTAELAERAGAEVLVRNDPQRRGKGYALQDALELLQRDPPDVVVVIDADCHPRPNTIETLAQTAWSTQRPVQALNLTDRCPAEGIFQSVSILGNRFTNMIRPLGLLGLGLPCRLMGTGMAIPWRLVRHAPLAGESLVEDMQWGIDLALRGHFPLFCPHARVASALPPAGAAFLSQRTRWDHGHLRTAAVQIPRLLVAAFRQRSLSLLGIAMDLSIPPLTLLVALWLGAAILAVAAWLFGASGAPLALLTGGGIALGVALALGWGVFCRKQVPPKAVVAVPFYMLRKMPIYARLLFRGQRTWVRTDRNHKSLSK